MEPEVEFVRFCPCVPMVLADRALGPVMSRHYPHVRRIEPRR